MPQLTKAEELPPNTENLIKSFLLIRWPYISCFSKLNLNGFVLAPANKPVKDCSGPMMPDIVASVVASLITTTLLSYAAAIALAGVQFLFDWRTPRRVMAIAALCQYSGTVLALLGMVYRYREIGTVGLLLVILSVLVADIRRPSSTPSFEAGLAILAVLNLLAVSAYFVA